jgi:transketolase
MDADTERILRLTAVTDLDVTALYYTTVTTVTTVATFDVATLRAHCPSGKVALVEPYYEGTLTADVAAALLDTPAHIEAIGVPHIVLSHYGAPEQHDEAIGFTPAGIRAHRETTVVSLITTSRSFIMLCAGEMTNGIRF